MNIDDLFDILSFNLYVLVDQIQVLVNPTAYNPNIWVHDKYLSDELLESRAPTQTYEVEYEHLLLGGQLDNLQGDFFKFREASNELAVEPDFL